MPAQTLFSVQIFEKRGKKLAAGTPFPFKSADAARLRAERAREATVTNVRLPAEKAPMLPLRRFMA